MMLRPLNEPSEHAIDAAMTAGGLDAVEELFYPCQKAAARRRSAAYPKPNGTGRKRGKVTIKVAFRRPDSWVGDRSCWHHYVDDVWVGSITEVRHGFCNINYRTHDGQTFAHSGGPTGAESYLEERYWLYGDPPVPATERVSQWFWRWLTTRR